MAPKWFDGGYKRPLHYSTGGNSQNQPRDDSGEQTTPQSAQSEGGREQQSHARCIERASRPHSRKSTTARRAPIVGT